MNMFRNNAIILAVTVLALAVIAAFVIVLVTGADSDKLVEFLKWLLYVLPTGIVGLLIAKNNATISGQIASVGTGVSNVETATNGAMTARLDNQTDAIVTALKAHTEEVVYKAISNSPTLPPPDYTHTNTIVN